MASVVKNSDGTNLMGADEAQPQYPTKRVPPKYPPPPRGGPRPGSSEGEPNKGPGYFTIYKKGQGYWTRMGTVAGGIVIGILSAQFIWNEHPNFHMSDHAAMVVIAVFLALFGLFAFHLINKPVNADFLIATDSEMKKVNWTSKKELIGSTKVVIGFMFLIAIFLFLFDLMFSWIFYAIGVLKVKP